MKYLAFFLYIFFTSTQGQASEISVRVLKDPTAAFINGQKSYVYELLLENVGSSTVHLQSLNVDGAALGILRLNHDQLKSQFKLLGNIDLDTISNWLQIQPETAPEANLIPPGRSALLFLGFTTSMTTVTPNKIQHLLVAQSESQSVELNYDVSLNESEPIVISPPFSGGKWFPFNAPSEYSPHRRSVLRFHGNYYIGQRFAIDWMRIGDDGRLLYPNSSANKNASYYSYGIPVLAVADGIVDNITEDLPENIPNSSTQAVIINLNTVTGNSVILDIGDSHYALYAHLQPGSVRVKKGDRVHRGQVLGLLGNSGNSSGPHLHFHVCDGPSALECQGVPYVVEELEHQTVRAEGETIESLRFIEVGERQSAKKELVWTDKEIFFPDLMP